MMMSATAGAAEHGLAQQTATSQQLEWVSKMGEIQQTIDQLSELKRGEGWVQHTESAEAQRIRTDRAEATLQILGELNLNMRSEIEKQGARVDLGRQIQFMRMLLDAEQQKEQAAHVMRQDIPEDSGTRQEHRQKDLNCGEEQTKGRQTSRRLKLLMRRLCEDERQREGAERELRNLISQVQDYKQEDAVQQREDTMIKSSDQKHEKSHKRQEYTRKDRANEQSSVVRQTAQQRAANSADATDKIDGSGYHSGSDRDSSSVRRTVMPASGEVTPHEYTPADKQEDQDGVDSGEQACVRLERRVETVYTYLCTMDAYWMKCGIMASLWVGMHCIVPICNRMSVKSNIANRIVISWSMTCGVLLVMSPASDQMAALGQNNPAPTNNFDMQLGARTKDWEDTTVARKCSKCGNARNTEPVEGKAMAAAATSTAGKTPLTMENVQEAVVKALATHAPAAAALAGMHKFERGNGFGLGEHTAFRAITEGATADEASPRGVGTGKKSDNGPRRGPSRPAQILNWIERISVAVGLLSIIVAMVVLWGETMGEIGQEAVATLKNVASTAFTYALACGSGPTARCCILSSGDWASSS